MHKLWLWLFLPILAAAVVLAASCDQKPSGPPPSASEKVVVVTPVYVIADIVRQVGGDKVDATWWVESGHTLADIKETPQRRNQLRSADLIITRGGIDPWTIEGMTNDYERRRVLRIDELYSARETDPQHYVWLDPRVAMELADEVAVRLAGHVPSREKVFKENAAKFRAAVISLNDRTREALDQIRARELMTLDRGFLPLAMRFGLIEARVEQINLADPSPYGVRVLRERAKAAGAKAIFVNADTPAALIRDWERRLELTVLPLEAIGSSAIGGGRSTYLQVLEYNLNQLVAGMKVATPPPTSLPAFVPATQPTFD